MTVEVLQGLHSTVRRLRLGKRLRFRPRSRYLDQGMLAAYIKTQRHPSRPRDKKPYPPARSLRNLLSHKQKSVYKTHHMLSTHQNFCSPRISDANDIYVMRRRPPMVGFPQSPAPIPHTSGASSCAVDRQDPPGLPATIHRPAPSPPNPSS